MDATENAVEMVDRFCVDFVLGVDDGVGDAPWDNLDRLFTAVIDARNVLNGGGLEALAEVLASRNRLPAT